MAEKKKDDVFKDYTLERDCELRFEIESKTQVVVEVCICLHFMKFVNCNILTFS